MSTFTLKVMEQPKGNAAFEAYRESAGISQRTRFIIAEQREADPKAFPPVFQFNPFLDRFEYLDGTPIGGGFSRNWERAQCILLAVATGIGQATMTDGTTITRTEIE
jgi:hypothetical protein